MPLKKEKEKFIWKRHMRTENKKQIGAARIGSSLTLIRSRVITLFGKIPGLMFAMPKKLL